MKKRPVFKWAPARPAMRADNIISSLARQRGDLVGFVPAYESEGKENMNFIMGNEYLKTWFIERENYEKQNYAAQQMNVTEEFKRRTVQKINTLQKKEKRLPIITLKMFQKRDGDEKKHIIKTDKKTTTEKSIHGNTNIFLRYKIECMQTDTDKTKANNKSNGNKKK